MWLSRGSDWTCIHKPAMVRFRGQSGMSDGRSLPPPRRYAPHATFVQLPSSKTPGTVSRVASSHGTGKFGNADEAGRRDEWMFRKSRRASPEGFADQNEWRVVRSN